jgi:hypothetical protein
MIVTGASVEDIAVIVRAVSATRYNGNVEIRDISDKSSSRTVRTSFTLRVKDGHAGSPGAKGSRGYDSSGTGPHGLRCSSLAACWHVHYDVLETLFRHHPRATVSSAMAKYDAMNFHNAAIATAAVNVGSQMQPHFPAELCECEHHTDDETRQVISEYSWSRRAWLEQAASRVVPPELDPLSAAAFRAPRESELGKYAAGGAYEAELTRCADCGCTS